MTQLVLMLNNYLQRPIAEVVSALSNLFDAFMNSKVMKAWEESAKKRAKYIEAQYTIRELSRLSDKELSDIGISRGEIYEIAHSQKRSNRVAS